MRGVGQDNLDQYSFYVPFVIIGLSYARLTLRAVLVVHEAKMRTDMFAVLSGVMTRRCHSFGNYILN